MKNILTYTILVMSFIACNSEEVQQKNEVEVKIEKNDSSKVTIDSTAKKDIPVNYSDSVNYTDTNGLKQGYWIRKWKGKLVEKYYFIDDTLNGHYETTHEEGYYKNGKKDGFQYSYYGEKESLAMVEYYENGDFIWGGFPAAGRDFLIPIKEFHIKKDSTFVKAPYINGQTWYKGSFCLLPDSLNNGRLMPHRYGIHKIYHMNGKIKGIVDYSEKTVQEYDSTGSLMYKANFDQSEIHRLHSLGRY